MKEKKTKVRRVKGPLREHQGEEHSHKRGPRTRKRKGQKTYFKR